MAFSLRKMLSNITYFKKPGEDDSLADDPNSQPASMENPKPSGEYSQNINFDRTEPDSTSKQAKSLNLHEFENNYTKTGSLSDTDVAKPDNKVRKEKKKSQKLKLDVKTANRSVDEASERRNNVENTPKQLLLESQASDIFSANFKRLDLNQSFTIYDGASDNESSEENVEIANISDTDSDISIVSHEEERISIKMCRKVDECELGSLRSLVQSITPESFGDVEIDKNEEDRINLLLNYQMKLEKIESFLKKLLSEFSFHIEVSKVFNSKSIVTALPGTDVTNIPKSLGEITYIDNVDRGVSPTGSWNIIMEKEDNLTRQKLKKQLVTIKQVIDQFVGNYMKKTDDVDWKSASVTYDVCKVKQQKFKRNRSNAKKKLKHFDFPDIRDAMLNLFNSDYEVSEKYTTILNDYEENDLHKCGCRCHLSHSSSETDSGLITKSNNRSMSITSSLGNFSLDTSTLTAYSESLDQNISYNSFEDSSLLSSMLQKAAIERITFYVQVHSIQLKCEPSETEYESKNIIKFHCPSCFSVETEENGLLRHILSQSHCEKIHFQYKTAYIKKCVQAGKEIQPSTVLNPMKMYRDENKIVCFGEATYACSLCFENLIVGESVLMAHIAEPEHVDRRERLDELLDE